MPNHEARAVGLAHVFERRRAIMDSTIVRLLKREEVSVDNIAMQVCVCVCVCVCMCVCCVCIVCVVCVCMVCTCVLCVCGVCVCVCSQSIVSYYTFVETCTQCTISHTCCVCVHVHCKFLFKAQKNCLKCFFVFYNFPKSFNVLYKVVKKKLTFH